MAKNVKAHLQALLENSPEITLARFAELLSETHASSAYLKKLLRATEIRLHPLVEGVRQDCTENLRRTLKALAALYPSNPQETRALVLEAKSHARFVLRRSPDDSWRNEVLLHLNTWLENPTIYPVWSSLRAQ